MRYLGVLLAAALSTSVLAHDEGHGPKLTDAGKMGGIVSSIIQAKDAKLGPKAVLVYKAELVRSEDGTVRVYLYDMEMKPLDLAKFDKTAKAVLAMVKKKKATRKPFSLKLDGEAFVGKAPKAPSRPFNIDVTFKEGDKNLLAAFDNLD